MADNDATAALFRELLGMTNGGTAGGRGPMSIPDDIMDSLAGDAAQDSLARERLIMEMRRQDVEQNDPRFVSLDLMEMESNDVDKFLAHARKKIIKRSKPTRQVCCAKIGGVLDQVLGPAGGEHAEPQGVRDRGQDDPTGCADEVAEDTNKVETTDPDLLGFIAEEFAYFEHDDNCMLSDPNFELSPDPLAEAKFIQKAIKKPGALRDHYGVKNGAEIPAAKARADYARLEKKAEGDKTLSGDEMKLFKRLQLFLKVLKPTANEKKEEGTDVQASKTGQALASFMEAQLNAYSAAKAGSGKGSPDPAQIKGQDYAGDSSRKERDDNKEYPTALTPAKGGSKKMAGAPGAVGTRGKDAGDPIGEESETDQIPQTTERRASGTATALASFMEASGQYETAKKKLALRGKDAGDLEAGQREKQPYGLPLKAAKAERSGADVYDQDGKKPRYEKGADPIGGGNEKDAAGSHMKK